jgi:hypothetical protein
VGIVINALSGIDIALWDIAGKVARLPLYRLLGGCRNRVEAYASGGFYQEGKSVDDLAAEAEGYRARGFKGMKMKIGRNPSTQTHLRHLAGGAHLCEVEPHEDIARVAAVRKALGPKAKLMADVNCAWSPAMAIAMGRALEPYDLYWLEEPVATDDIDGSARVAAALATPVAGYETEIGLYGFRDLITRGAVAVVQPDLAWSGGFSTCVCQCSDVGGIAALCRLDPERAGARIRPEPERAARRTAQGADRYRCRWHGAAAAAAGSRHRTGSRRGRTLSHRLSRCAGRGLRYLIASTAAERRAVARQPRPVAGKRRHRSAGRRPSASAEPRTAPSAAPPRSRQGRPRCAKGAPGNRSGRVAMVRATGAELPVAGRGQRCG